MREPPRSAVLLPLLVAVVEAVGAAVIAASIAALTAAGQGLPAALSAPQVLTPPRRSAHLCPPLPPPSGPTVTVSTEADLRDRAFNAAPATTVLVAPGIYNMRNFVHIRNDRISLRGSTGNRGDVILDFGGMTGGHFGVLVEADDVTIADLTIRNARDHGVSINGRDRPVLYNLHIRDTGDQLVKVNPWGNGSEDGLLVDCYHGIAFGNSSQAGINHTGGIVRNNFLYASLLHGVAVEMVRAGGWLVAHNTILLLRPDGVTWGMEARFAESQGTFAYNLTNMRIWLDRDGARGAGRGNIADARPDWFVNPSAHDLHLTDRATAAIDRAGTAPGVTDDFDGEARPMGAAPDVGGDEYR